MYDSGRSSNVDRGTISVEYAIAVAVFITLSGVFITGFVNEAVNSSKAVSEVEGDRISHEVATGIEDTDTLIRRAQGTNAEFNRNGQWKPYIEKTIDNPEEVGGDPYVIRIDGGEGSVTVETRRLNQEQISKTAYFNISSGTSVPNKTVSGGDVVLRYNSSADRVEVEE